MGAYSPADGFPRLPPYDFTRLCMLWGRQVNKASKMLRLPVYICTDMLTWIKTVGMDLPRCAYAGVGCWQGAQHL